MNPQVGQELKRVRESKGVSLDQAARELCLRAELLRELEEGKEDRNVPDVYRKMSLRMYARYLGVAFNRTRDDKTAELSPVDGCVELAYSEKMREEPEPKKRRFAGAGTVLAVTAVLILATGLWSLNAKISRLNFEEKPAPVAAPVDSEPMRIAAPAAVAETVRLEDSVLLTLTPKEEIPAGTPDAP
ncbi:MAG: helix-turn-helix domain-containing protein [Planctomycetota bacterium]